MACICSVRTSPKARKRWASLFGHSICLKDGQTNRQTGRQASRQAVRFFYVDLYFLKRKLLFIGFGGGRNSWDQLFCTLLASFSAFVKVPTSPKHSYFKFFSPFATEPKRGLDFGTPQRAWRKRWKFCIFMNDCKTRARARIFTILNCCTQKMDAILACKNQELGRFEPSLVFCSHT